MREILDRLPHLHWTLVGLVSGIRRRFRGVSPPSVVSDEHVGGNAVTCVETSISAAPERRFRRGSPAVTPRTGLLRTQVVASAESLSALAPQWRQLYFASGCRIPFLHPSWIQQWWRAFGQSRPLTNHALKVLTFERDGRLIGIMPFYRTTYGVGTRLVFQYIRPLGSDPNVTEIRTPLILPGSEPAVIRAAEEYFAQDTGSWDLLNWGSYPEPLAPGDGLQGRRLLHVRHERVECFILRMPQHWDEFAAALNHNTKEAIRKAHNALKRDRRHVAFESLTKSEEILPLLSTFFELHRRRARLQGVVHHPDVFSVASHRRFLTAAIEAMAPEGLVRLFVLRVDGAIVATRLGFVIEDTLYFYYSGFEPAFAKYSVMTRLVVEMMKWAMASGFTTINLSTGRDHAKLRWNPEAESYRTFSHVGPRWKSRIALALVDRADRQAF
jgi:CelD/BcsL family acetyltransferase involved in cellulose biosynthesis